MCSAEFFFGISSLFLTMFGCEYDLHGRCAAGSLLMFGYHEGAMLIMCTLSACE